MNCEHARLLIGSNPTGTSAELSEHLGTCEACRQFQTEMVALEGDLRLALEQPPPARTPRARPTPVLAAVNPAPTPAPTTASRPAPTPIRRRPARWREWSLAASVVVVAIAIGWFIRPTPSLAHAVVAHVAGEVDFAKPANTQDLLEVLRKAGVDADLSPGKVTYAHTCWLRGHWVPHLLLQTSSGPVTVIVMPDEHVNGRTSFHDSGYDGVIVPAQQGSIAVLAQGTADVAGVANQMKVTYTASAAK